MSRQRDPLDGFIEGTWVVTVTDPNGLRKTITITHEARVKVWTEPLNAHAALYVAGAMLRDKEDAEKAQERLRGLIQDGTETAEDREESQGAPEDGAAWGRRVRRSWWPFNSDTAGSDGDGR